MIKNIKIKNNYKTLTLNLDNPVNIIVGEKGTGKSTLLQIIAEAIVNKKVFKNGYDWLRNKANFEIASINIDDTEINAQDFAYIYELESRDNTKEKGILEIQKKLPGFISQNDNRKNSLDSSEHIEKQKEQALKRFVEKISYSNDMLRDFNDFEELFKEQQQYTLLQEKPLPLGIIFQEKFSLYENLFSQNLALLDYSIENEENKINQKQSKIEDIIQNIKSLNLKYKDLLFENNNEIIFETNEQIKKDFYKQLNLDIEQNTKSITIYKKYLEALNKNKKALNCFSLSFKKAKNEFTQQLEYDKKAEVDKATLIDYFKNMGIILKQMKNKYQQIIKKDININWELNEKDPQNENIEYRLEKFILNEDLEEEKYSILNKWVNSSNKTHTVADVLLGSIKNSYDIKKIVKDLIKDKIKVYAGDEEYKNLSTGQKTLFGVTHAIKTLSNVSNEQYLLLDQVEDNLDNKTIYEKIVPLLNEQVKAGKQVFIVTHNANIGTLIDGNTITTDMFNEKFENKFILNEKIDNNQKMDTPQSLYLEGSMEAFYKRQQAHECKIKKMKGVK